MISSGATVRLESCYVRYIKPIPAIERGLNSLPVYVAGQDASSLGSLLASFDGVLHIVSGSTLLVVVINALYSSVSLVVMHRLTLLNSQRNSMLCRRSPLSLGLLPRWRGKAFCTLPRCKGLLFLLSH